MFRSSGRGAAYHPIARTEGLSVTTSGDETLVYDRENFTIHRLTAELASVWYAADGTRDLTTLSVFVGQKNTQESVHLLSAMGLMQGEPVRKSLLSRRRVLAGATGAVAAGALIAPAAASGRCNENADCPACPEGEHKECRGFDENGKNGYCACYPGQWG